MTQVSQEYLIGIKEGRSFLSANPDLTKQEMAECKESARVLMLKHSQPIKDLFKGEYDFWVNQIKKGLTQ